MPARTCPASRVPRSLLPALLAALLVAPLRADVTGEQVKRTIRRGVSAVQSMQRGDGTWVGPWEAGYRGGETCLATLALLQAGEPVDSPGIARALSYIRELPDERVYVVSLKIMVLARADPQRYRPELEAATRWLIRAQDSSGLWSYQPGQQRFDHSNSQFALLALHEAAQAGVKISSTVWRNALAGVTRTQNDDGGWTYQIRDASYGSMTAANVANLLILGQRLPAGHRVPIGGQPKCGVYRTSRPLAGGLNWLARHFRADGNPRRGNQHIPYWLYAVERAGMLSGQRYFGEHDWYRAGARYLVNTQRGDGTWNGRLVDTCFALLFLAKGHKALLIQKLQWSQDDAWSPRRYDLDHLIAFIGERLGQPVAWQVVPFDAPLEEWLTAPLLYVQGHRFPRWNAAQQAKVRAFVEQGGTLLAEACDDRQEFRRGFEEFAAATFPEFPLRELGAQHAIYHVHFECPARELLGLDLGCRTSVILSPRDLSCAWELANVPGFGEEALRLGTNIAAYAIGRRPLIDRLDVVVLPEEEQPEPGPPARDALRLAQVVYEGDWRPFPRALVALAELLQQEAGLSVITRYRSVRLTAPDLYTCPILYLAGSHAADLSAEERAALVRHLRRGGFLLADNCCGPEPFDTSFRTLLRELLPDATLQPLPLNHPILRGSPGFDVRQVRYGPDVARERPDLQTPELWGLELDGRLALVYSPLALGCGLEGQAFDGCWGLASEDARRLAANIILYALTH